jgi:small subunit ribosomal protein S20
MANIKSAKKRIKVIATKTAHNKSIKSRVKTIIKKVDTAVANGDKEAAKSALTEAIKAISSATSKGIFHKNTASRKISNLTKAVNSME